MTVPTKPKRTRVETIQARTLNFACGMDMMKGTVVVQ